METLSPEKSGAPGLHVVSGDSNFFVVLLKVIETAGAFPEAHGIWDLGNISFSEINSVAINNFIHGLPALPRRTICPKIAFVAPSDVGYGIMRMFEMRADGKLPFQMMVFRTMKEAEEWAR